MARSAREIKVKRSELSNNNVKVQIGAMENKESPKTIYISIGFWTKPIDKMNNARSILKKEILDCYKFIDDGQLKLNPAFPKKDDNIFIVNMPDNFNYNEKRNYINMELYLHTSNISGDGRMSLSPKKENGLYNAALYIAVDPGSWKLKSILKQDRPHLIPYVLQPEDGGIYDPYDEMIKALYRNDLGEYQTVIFDTVSVFARELLQAISNSGKFSDKHVEIYKGKRKLNMAMMGDYGATHQCVLDVLGAIKDTGKNMIVVAHDQMVEPDADESGPTIVGPATVGKALVGPLAGWFDTTIRTEARLSKQAPSNPLTPREVEYWVVTEARKPYLAKIRISTPTNPIS